MPYDADLLGEIWRVEKMQLWYNVMKSSGFFDAIITVKRAFSPFRYPATPAHQEFEEDSIC